MRLSNQVKAIRSSFLSGDLKRDFNKEAPDDITRFCDICYANDPVWQLLDLYLPKEKKRDKLPVIVSIHGGGWVYGSKAIYQYYCMDLAKRGFAVINFTYRLAPEYKFPSALEDTNSVMKFILENKERYSLDEKNVFAVGDSAGGNYLALYASILSNPTYRKRFKFKVPKGITLRGVALNCGYYDANGRLGERRDSLLDELLSEKSHFSLDDFDVPSKITKDFPPTYIMSANNDFLLSQAPLLKDTLDAFGVQNKMKIYGNDDVKLGHVFHVDVATKQAKECNDDECNFFLSLIK